LKQEKKHFLG